MNPKRTVLIIVFFLVPLYITQLLAGGEWYKLYEDGIEAMEDGDYKAASDLFIQAIQDNPDDDENVRTYGMHSIEYFPHRELGICLYHLGDKTGAQMELQISMKMEPSDRAKQYLAQLGAGLPPAKKTEPEEDVAVGVAAASAVEQKKETEMIVGKQTIKLVGERMGVAVLPFENKGASRDLGEIILDKMITVLWTQERFKVMERAALNQVLAEQSLGQSGALDATTAAEIGKGIGVDAIVIGSVAAYTCY
jgi:tetratricopeptide (TPR) repeat protein